MSPKKLLTKTPMLKAPERQYTSIEAFILDAFNAAISFDTLKDDPRFEEILRLYRENSEKAYAKMAGDVSRYAQSSAMQAAPSRVAASRNLRCQGQVYFCKQGVPSLPIPQSSKLSMVIGSAIHAEVLAGLVATCPETMVAFTEMQLDMPSWWPTDPEWASQRCFLDLVYQIPEGSPVRTWFAPEVNVPLYLIVDVKSMASYGAREHATVDMATSLDSFGYQSQLAVYRASLATWAGVGTADIQTCLLGISRDRPNKIAVPRVVSTVTLNARQAALIARLQGGAEDIFLPELLLQDPKKAQFYCQGDGLTKAAMCGFAADCSKKRTEAQNAAASTTSILDA